MCHWLSGWVLGGKETDAKRWRSGNPYFTLTKHLPNSPTVVYKADHIATESGILRKLAGEFLNASYCWLLLTRYYKT